jgi:hypothetical protein
MMDHINLLRLLTHIKVWIPYGNPIRIEIEDIIAQLKQQIQ